jgi:hypothetical protein
MPSVDHVGHDHRCKLFAMVIYSSNYCRGRIIVWRLNSKIVALLNYVIVNQMMMLLLWRWHYLMAPMC